jgi:serine protease Do
MNAKRLFCLLPFALCLTQFLAPPATTFASSREAVKKAIAATVAVEWRAHEWGQLQARARNRLTARLPDAERRVQTVETDPDTGKQILRESVVAMSPQRPDLALASGTVISNDGLIVTLSNEAVEGHYTVTFDDGKSLPARLVVDDRRNGLRLLKVDAKDLPYLSLADSNAEPGDQVFAAFCTNRLERAAAQGMVAARNKNSWMQLDLAAGPMSTGGPLVDEQGRLIGIVSGRMAPNPHAQTTNFALPLEAVRALVASRQGENTVVVHRGFLGIQLENKQEDGREHVIAHLLSDSPAGAAGMADGDELVKLDGEKVVSAPEAATIVARHAAGDKLSVVVLHDGQEKTLEITAGKPPAGLEGGQAGARQIGGGGGLAPSPANVVRPEQVYVLSEDGKKVAVAAEHVDALRSYARALRLRIAPDGQTGVAAEPLANTIRVERSDLDKKLSEVGQSVESLQQQVKKLTEEIQALRSKLAEQK